MIKVRVYHTYYGCDTGCCGHVIEITKPDGKEQEHFDFDHPGYRSTDAEKAAWVKELVEKTVRERWPDCLDSLDWSTISVELNED